MLMVLGGIESSLTSVRMNAMDGFYIRFSGVGLYW
jgi:hypothetical protein